MPLELFKYPTPVIDNGTPDASDKRRTNCAALISW
jgi:hypothetical protein